VTVKLYNFNGTQSSISTLVLDPKAQQTLDVSAVLNGQDGGYAILTAATPPLAITVGGAGQNQWSLQSVSSIQGDHFLSTAFLDGVAAVHLPSRRTSDAGQIDKRPPLRSNGANLRFMLINLSSASNQFAIETRAADGSVTGQLSLTISPGQALTTSAKSLFQHSETNTSLRINSTEESVVFGLYGVPDGILPVAAAVPADAESRLIPALLLQSATISAASGGTITVATDSTNALLGNIKLVIPAGAISRDADIQILSSPLVIGTAAPRESARQLSFALSARRSDI
jgi:hypothetical protein